jgi:hypothetical protein
MCAEPDHERGARSLNRSNGAGDVTSIELAVLRLAATLTHAISSLGLVLHTAGRWRIVVSHHPMRLPVGVVQYTPCEFRRLILERARVDQPGSRWFGEARGEQIDIRFFELADCRRDDHGVVWCRTSDGDEIHCFATLVTPPELYDLLALRSPDEEHSSSEVEHLLSDTGASVLLEFDRDHELAVTLVHCRTGPGTPWTADDACRSVSQLALITTVEDLISSVLSIGM